MERCLFNVFNEGITVKIFELSRFYYFWMSFQRIMFMSSIDKTVVRNVPLIKKSGLNGISTHDLSDNGAAITCS